jgi:hypothetical protein
MTTSAPRVPRGPRFNWPFVWVCVATFGFWVLIGFLLARR